MSQKSGFKRGVFLILLYIRSTKNSVAKIYCNLSGAFQIFPCLFLALLTNLSCIYKTFFVQVSLWSSRIDETRHKWHLFQFRWRALPQHSLLKNQVPNPAKSSRNAPAVFISSPKIHKKFTVIDVKMKKKTKPV